MSQIEDRAENARALASSPQQKQKIAASLPLRASVNERKDMDTTTHDFLSLAGRSAIEAQDLVQPCENTRAPQTSDLLPYGGAGRACMDYAVQGSNAVGNGTLDLAPNIRRTEPMERPMEGMKDVERLENLTHWPGVQPKFRLSDLGHPRSIPQGILLPIANTRWVHQQQASLEAFDISRKLSKVPSEEGEEEEDEILNQSCNSTKETIHFSKSVAPFKSEGKVNDMKAITPRSKHSATEQRRRSKINDRLQMLRQLLPNADQKRDKASFLLEVIGYIQILQERVKKYENDEQRRAQERTKAITWDAMNTCRDSSASSAYLPLPSTVTSDAKDFPESNGHLKRIASPLKVTCENDGDLMPRQGLAIQTCIPQGSQACVSSYQETNIAVTQSVSLTLSGMQHAPLENISVPSVHPKSSYSSTPQPITEAHALLEHLVKYAERKTLPEVNSSSSKIVEAIPQTSTAPCPSQRPNEEDCGLQRHEREANLVLESDKQIIHCAERSREKSVEKEPLVIHGGRIKVSSNFSEKLWETLTQALQTSGIDLTQTNISVQIDLATPGGVVVSSLSKGASPQEMEIVEWEQEQTKKRQKMEDDS